MPSILWAAIPLILAPICCCGGRILADRSGPRLGEQHLVRLSTLTPSPTSPTSPEWDLTPTPSPENETGGQGPAGSAAAGVTPPLGPTRPTPSPPGPTPSVPPASPTAAVPVDQPPPPFPASTGTPSPDLPPAVSSPSSPPAPEPLPSTIPVPDDDDDDEGDRNNEESIPAPPVPPSPTRVSTPSPTATFTAPPTPAPTAAPTASPTPVPTATPTLSPTPSPTATPAPVLLTGRVFEDTTYTGGDGTPFDGGDVGLPNVAVELYAGSTFLTSTTTAGTGIYTFSNVTGSGDFIVRVVSADIGDADTPPAAGFKTGFSGAVAEQTYEHNGLAGNGGAGALGGNDPAFDDTAIAPRGGPGDANVTVTINGGDVTGLDLGFAFNLTANTNDAGQGSLRQAIANANAISGTDRLVFNIAGPSPHTIRPDAALPAITDPVIIDGATQPDFASAPVIELDGAGAGVNSNGLHIRAGRSLVRGLVINRFANHGIYLETEGDNLIAGNYIGTDAAGAAGLANGGSGIYIFGCAGGGNAIGGLTAADHNLISGNSSGGLTIYFCDGNRIQGNYVGTDVAGLAALPNTSTGIYIESSSNNLIGGTTPGAGNLISANTDEGLAIWGGSAAGANNLVQGNLIGVDVNETPMLGNGKQGIEFDDAFDNRVEAGNIIAANGQHGVYIRSGSRNVVLTNTIHANGGNGIHHQAATGEFRANSIYANGALGIDLVPAFSSPGIVTPNDRNDVDSGPNDLFNFPIIEDATLTGAAITITGYARPGSIIEFFIADPDPSGFGEGQTSLGAFTEGTAADADDTTSSYGPGPAGQDTTNRFSFTFPAGPLTIGNEITATATDTAGNTSEFGPNAAVN